MAVSDDLINFDLIESHKENIQSLPGGRSARQLASILSPLPTGKSIGSATLDETKTLNDAIRQEYENELQSIAESDDPLEIYDRYVKWTLTAYPSAQATPQSQLLPLLERATKAFLTSADYKNDPRYLKLWLHYIRLFSDAPREVFAFLARHNVGQSLGLFYEDFAAWLEGAGRWNQAEEVYKMGIEKEARPVDRLTRKHAQFQQRFNARPQNDAEPSSPALPTVRPALAAKMDPFAATPRSDEQQAQRLTGGAASAAASRAGKPKMAIFADSDNSTPPPVASTNGWDNIGSMKERKKENTIQPTPWAGETLKAGKRVGTVPKMEIFKDSRSQNSGLTKASISKGNTEVVNTRTGRGERVFVKIEAVYPNEREEYSFEELRAINRGWAGRDWHRAPSTTLCPSTGNARLSPKVQLSSDPVDLENLSASFQHNFSIHDTSTQSMVGMPEAKPLKQRRLKMREVKQETQTGKSIKGLPLFTADKILVKTRLESPTGRKMKRKASSEATMTFHSKVATNEIYDMFNAPHRPESKDDNQSGEDTDFGDDTYSTAGESTGTGRLSATTSEYGDDTLASVAASREDNPSSQPDTVSPWSDFTASKHMPKAANKANTRPGQTRIDSDDLTENMDSSQNHTQASGMGNSAFDTQAIALIANQDFGDLDTQVIAQMAGDVGEEEQEETMDHANDRSEELQTPVGPEYPEEVEVHNKPRFVPLPPEDYEPTPFRAFRDPAAAAQNKLPFMTPIVERTESSLAPSTICSDNDYFNSRTPSRSTCVAESRYNSPSKLKVDSVLLDSPQRDSPTSVKRKLLQLGETEAESCPSSPQKKILQDSPSKNVPKPSFQIAKPVAAPSTNQVDEESFQTSTLPVKLKLASQPLLNGPIIQDRQCNPCDPSVRTQILDALQPPLLSYAGFDDSSADNCSHYPLLKSYADKVGRQKIAFSPRKSQNDKTLTKAVPPILKFSGTRRVYAVKRELGKGAFAPVYLVDSYDPDEAEDPQSKEVTVQATSTSILGQSSARSALEAVKTETPPLTLVWEFHVLRLLRSRLGPQARAMQSVVLAHECHLFRDECYLVLDYHHQGTLLDLVNLARAENVRAGKPSEGVEEVVAIWLSSELLRTMEAIHATGILHGDLKADNCLVRFTPNAELSAPYDSDGSEGWSSKGLTLIDFGRGIDTRAFRPDVRFMADWAASPQDCAEIREMRPWTAEIDLFGAAGVIHSLLFGRYIDTVAVTHAPQSNTATDDNIGLNQKKEHKLRDPLKRYWERDLWTRVFGFLLNPSLHSRSGSGSGSAVGTGATQTELAAVRREMQAWLAREGERRDLRAGIRRLERLLGAGKVR